MIQVIQNNAIFLPAVSKIGLIDLPIQNELVILPRESKLLDLGYTIGLDRGLILDLIVCGELRRAGIRLSEDRQLHTPAHSKTDPLKVMVVNTSDIDVVIHKGDHALHAIPLTITNDIAVTYD